MYGENIILIFIIFFISIKILKDKTKNKTKLYIFNNDNTLFPTFLFKFSIDNFFNKYKTLDLNNNIDINNNIYDKNEYSLLINNENYKQPLLGVLFNCNEYKLKDYTNIDNYSINEMILSLKQSKKYEEYVINVFNAIIRNGDNILINTNSTPEWFVYSYLYGYNLFKKYKFCLLINEEENNELVKKYNINNWQSLYTISNFYGLPKKLQSGVIYVSMSNFGSYNKYYRTKLIDIYYNKMYIINVYDNSDEILKIHNKYVKKTLFKKNPSKNEFINQLREISSYT